jgi:hypothetical protein
VYSGTLGLVGHLNQPSGPRHTQERVIGGFTSAVCGIPHLQAACYMDPNDIMHGEADGTRTRTPTLTLTLIPTLIPTLTLTPAEPDGILRLEGACLMYMGLRLGWFTLDTYNARHRSFNWPAGHRPPELVQTIAEGAAGGRPKPAAKLPYTASQTNHWARHSLELLRPLIEDADARGLQALPPRLLCPRLQPRPCPRPRPPAPSPSRTQTQTQTQTCRLLRVPSGSPGWHTSPTSTSSSSSLSLRKRSPSWMSSFGSTSAFSTQFPR